LTGYINAISATKDNDFLGIYHNDLAIGGVIFNGQEFHGAVLPEYRGKWMNREFMGIVKQEQIKRNGLKTSVQDASPLVEKAVIRFCQKLGIEVMHV
jgi:hypothetical protein